MNWLRVSFGSNLQCSPFSFQPQERGPPSVFCLFSLLLYRCLETHEGCSASYNKVSVFLTFLFTPTLQCRPIHPLPLPQICVYVYITNKTYAHPKLPFCTRTCPLQKPLSLLTSLLPLAVLGHQQRDIRTTTRSFATFAARSSGEIPPPIQKAVATALGYITIAL